MSRLTTFLALIIISLNTAYADTLDLNFSDESFRAIYNLDRGSRDYSFGGLFRNPNNGPSAKLAHLGLEVAGDGQAGSGAMEGKLGVRFYLLSADQIDVAALALGGNLTFFPDASKVGFGVHAYYAPEVVSGLDGDRFWEWGARLEFRLFEAGTLYVGYREIETRLEGSSTNITIDDGGFVGLNIRF